MCSSELSLLFPICLNVTPSEMPHDLRISNTMWNSSSHPFLKTFTLLTIAAATPPMVGSQSPPITGKAGKEHVCMNTDRHVHHHCSLNPEE